MGQGILCPTLVGRSEEFDALTALLAQAQEGRGTVSFVIGEAGVGKSRLGREIAMEARRRDMNVLAGRAVQSSSPTSFRPLSEALMAHLRAAGTITTPELAPFLPALGRLAPEWRHEAAAAVDDSILMLGEGVLRFLRVVAGGRGCVLLLEDLHWADPETVAVLEYLSDNVHAQPVVCVATARSEEPGDALRLARALQARRAGLVLELPRLSDEDVERMARACLCAAGLPDAVTKLLRSSADGLPFFVEELLAAAIESKALAPGKEGWVAKERIDPRVPITFADTVSLRLQRLGSEARRVVQAAAILGRYFDWTLLPGLTGLDEQRVTVALRRAADTQLVVPEADARERRFRFRHALTRDAVLDELLPPERAALARAALSAVEVARPGLPGEWCELGADLAEAAGDRRRTAELLLESGRRAIAEGALATAEVALERAREVEPEDSTLSVEVNETLAEALALAGKTDRAFEIGDELLRTGPASPGARERRARIHLILARAATTANQWSRAEEQLARARRETEESSETRPRLDALAAQVAIGDHRPDEAAALARRAFAGAERGDLPEVACEALEVIGRCARLRDLAEAEAAFERARALAEQHDLTVWQIRAMLELGTIDLLSGAPLDRLHRARELASRAGALATVCAIDLQIAAGSLIFGERETALQATRRCADIARVLHLGPLLGMNLTLEAEIHLLEGRLAAMEESLQGAVAAAGEHPDVAASIHAERANLALVHEDRRAALQELDRAMELARRSPSMSPHPFRGLWTLLRSVEGCDGEASCAELRESGATVQRLNRGYLHYAEAVLRGREGRGAEAEAAQAAGDADLHAMPWYRSYGRRLVAEAAIADRWGDPARWLREALAVFEELKQEQLIAACRSLLRKAGAPVPRKGRGDAAVPGDLRAQGVTSREMEVLHLLAAGLSNREIGERLYLSHRTVERHAENLMSKLRIHGRSQLVAFAAARPASSQPSS